MKFATLLYIKNSRGDYLLIERVKEPNKGFLSPPGGKLKTEIAESPFACAVREANEECGINSDVKDWELIGIVTEKAYPAIGDIMIFCFSYKKNFDELPEEINEGKFCFIPAREIQNAKIPETDKLYFWNFVLKDNRRLFSIHIDCTKEKYICKIEQD